MNKPKLFLQYTTALGTIGIGIYMLGVHPWPTPPAVSGAGFLLAGLGLWIPHCPFINRIFKDRVE